MLCIQINHTFSLISFHLYSNLNSVFQFFTHVILNFVSDHLQFQYLTNLSSLLYDSSEISLLFQLTYIIHLFFKTLFIISLFPFFIFFSDPKSHKC